MIAVFFAVPALLLVMAVVAVAVSWRTTGSEIDRLFDSLPPARSTSPALRLASHSAR